jgi:hypothetical protein
VNKQGFRVLDSAAADLFLKLPPSEDSMRQILRDNVARL